MSEQAQLDPTPWTQAPSIPPPSPRMLSNLGIYGLGHLVVDATCTAVVCGIIRPTHASTETTWTLFFLYNLLAFGTQAFFGSMVDMLQKPRLSAIAGCLLTASAAPVARFSPVLSICLAGTGNSLFHVGGGAICLSLAPGRATPAGLFVAPGAIGLALGMLSGAVCPGRVWPWAGLLLILALAMFLQNPPRINYRSEPSELKVGTLSPILLLLCFVIAVRAVCGTTITGPWKGNATLPLLLAISATFGKGLGGIIADRFGWIRVATVAVLACVSLVPAGVHNPSLALAAMFLLQATTGVTLAAISRLFPARPAFAFGLASLAVLIGSAPSYANWQGPLNTPTCSAILLLVSAGALLIALRALVRPTDMPAPPAAKQSSHFQQRP